MSVAEGEKQCIAAQNPVSSGNCIKRTCHAAVSRQGYNYPNHGVRER